MFQVGDAVRVKAGSPVAMTEYEGKVPKWLVGQKLVNLHIPQAENCAVEMPGHDHTLVKIFYLEPWNDAEEWDGAKWVAKKTETPPKPAVVINRGGATVVTCDSTNQAVKTAKNLSETFPGTEYVVYQEKASFKVEPKSKAEEMCDAINRAKRHDFVEFKEDGKPIAQVKVKSALSSGNIVTVTYEVQS